jgi:hypothetical protein
MKTISIFALILGSLAWSAAAEELRADTTGFYPLWENTAWVEKNGDVRVGTTGMQAGIGDVLHVGTQPINLAYRAPNLYAKLALPSAGRWRFATQVGAQHLLAGASRAFFSPMYSSRLDNPDFALTLLPISGTATVMLGERVEIHQTLTALGVFSGGPIRNSVTGGYSVVAEFNSRGRHGISLHAAEVGFTRRDLTIVGAAYRYRNTWLELRLGYFYRFSKAGSQAAPLMSLGVLL